MNSKSKLKSYAQQIRTALKEIPQSSIAKEAGVSGVTVHNTLSSKAASVNKVVLSISLDKIEENAKRNLKLVKTIRAGL